MKTRSFLLLILYLLSPSVFAEADKTDQKKTTKDRDVHLSVAGYHVIPEDARLASSQAVSIQLASAINFFQVGFEYFTVINSPHSYRYSVPYGKLEEHREYDIHSGHIFIRISPWHLGYITPYIGGYLGGSYIIDKSDNSSVFNEKVASDKYAVIGPVAGMELLPNSLISIFIEARKSYHLKGTIQRETVNYVDQFGNTDTQIDNIKFNALYIGAGLRFNFY